MSDRLLCVTLLGFFACFQPEKRDRRRLAPRGPWSQEPCEGRGWQRQAGNKQVVWPPFSLAERATVRSQSGPLASVPYTALDLKNGSRAVQNVAFETNTPDCNDPPTPNGDHHLFKHLVLCQQRCGVAQRYRRSPPKEGERGRRSCQKVLALLHNVDCARSPRRDLVRK